MFEMVVSQEELLAALNTLKGEYAAKPNFDFPSQEKDFNGRSENQLKVVGETNRLRLISPTGSEIRLNADISLAGAFVFPFWPFYEFVKTLPPLSIKMAQRAGEDEFVRISCGASVSSRWKLYPVESFPIKGDDEERGEAVLTMTASWLAAALARVIPFAAKGKTIEDSRRNVYFTRNAQGRMVIEVANAATLIQVESPFYMPKVQGIILDRDSAVALQRMAADSGGTVTLYQNELAITAQFQLAVAKFRSVAYPRNWKTNEEDYPNWSKTIAPVVNAAGIFGATPGKYHLAGLLEVGSGYKSITLSNIGVTANAADGGSITHNAPILWNLAFEYTLPYAQIVLAAKAVSVNPGAKAEEAWEELHAAWDSGDPEVIRISINLEQCAVWLQRGCVSVYALQEKS